MCNGFVHREGENRAIERAHIEYRWGRSAHRMRTASIEIGEDSGVEHRIRADALASVPILRGGVWIEETHAAFELEGPGAPRCGQGVVEHVWRPGVGGILVRCGQLLPVLRRFRR